MCYNILMSRVIVLGGYTTGRRLLDTVADAACNQFDYTDAGVLTFPEAMSRPDKLDSLVRGQDVLTHSAALYALVHSGGIARIRNVLAINPPEPRHPARLATAAAKKTSHLAGNTIVGPQRRGTANVLASNMVQSCAHPIVHAKSLREISRFSATETLAQASEIGAMTLRVDTAGDEFFGPHELRAWDGTSAVFPGRHDAVLIDPVGFLSQLPRNALLR